MIKYVIQIKNGTMTHANAKAKVIMRAKKFMVGILVYVFKSMISI